MAIVRRYIDGRWVTINTDSFALAAQSGDVRDWYRLLRAYYDNNGLYDELRAIGMELGYTEVDLRSVRNPANRVVEFYAAKLWPGSLPEALPIQTGNDAIISPIRRVWRWSNWAAKKQVFARWLAMYGDVFAKIETKQDDGGVYRVFIKLIDPRYVPEFEEDERGFFTHLRTDIPDVEKRSDGTKAQVWYTEVWDKQRGDLRIWRAHSQGYDAALERLGTPDVQMGVEEAFDIDFIPAVHARFKEDGEDRGAGAFAQQIDKIDEANVMASRLHQELYRYNVPSKVLESEVMDSRGRPMAPPLIDEESSGAVEVVNGMLVWRLPSGWSFKDATPDIDYDAALAILEAQMDELEEDLPELGYYRLRDQGDLSGRAVRLMLGDAVDRVEEARGMAEASLERLHQMALTIGSNTGLFGDIGSYEAGDFEHSFVARPVLPLSRAEEATTVKAFVDAGLPLRTALREAGWSTERVERALEEKREAAAEEQSELGEALMRSLREFDQGG